MAIKVYTGTQTIDESAGAGTETVIKDIAALGSGFRQRISSIWLDCVNSTVGGTARIKLYLGAAGLTERTIADYDLAFIAGEAINLLKDGPIEIDTRITIYIATAGGGAAGVDIYYRIPYDDSIEKLQSVFNGTGDTDDVDLKARYLEINNDTGDGVYFHSSGANGNGVNFFGNGSGSGFSVSGGISGQGFLANGGTSSGAGAWIRSTSANGRGMYIQGTGIRAGLQCDGGATSGDGIQTNGGGIGNGIFANSGAGATGNGVLFVSQAVNGCGLRSQGSGNLPGIYGQATGAGGDGLRCDGNGTGNGGLFYSGLGATGDGIRSQALSILGYGAFLQGIGSGSGLYCNGGISGGGIYAIGNGVAEGIAIRGGASGHGMTIWAGGLAGDGINIDSTASVGLRIRSQISHAIYAYSIGGGGSGIFVTGNGTGPGIYASGGVTGDGVAFVAGGGNAHGFVITGSLAGNGINCTGGATGSGAYFVAGGGNGYGLYTLGFGTGEGARFVGGATAHGFIVVGAAASRDFYCKEIDAPHNLGSGANLSDNLQDMAGAGLGFDRTTDSLAIIGNYLVSSTANLNQIIALLNTINSKVGS